MPTARTLQDQELMAESKNLHLQNSAGSETISQREELESAWPGKATRRGLANAPCRFIIRDRDSIYSSVVDSTLRSSGLAVLKTPFRSPQANAFCERLIGTVRRECLNYLIPLSDRHLRNF